MSPEIIVVGYIPVIPGVPVVPGVPGVPRIDRDVNITGIPPDVPRDHKDINIPGVAGFRSGHSDVDIPGDPVITGKSVFLRITVVWSIPWGYGVPWDTRYLWVVEIPVVPLGQHPLDPLFPRNHREPTVLHF